MAIHYRQIVIFILCVFFLLWLFTRFSYQYLRLTFPHAITVDNTIFAQLSTKKNSYKKSDHESFLTKKRETLRNNVYLGVHRCFLMIFRAVFRRHVESTPIDLREYLWYPVAFCTSGLMELLRLSQHIWIVVCCLIYCSPVGHQYIWEVKVPITVVLIKIGPEHREQCMGGSLDHPIWFGLVGNGSCFLPRLLLILRTLTSVGCSFTVWYILVIEVSHVISICNVKPDCNVRQFVM